VDPWDVHLTPASVDGPFPGQRNAGASAAGADRRPHRVEHDGEEQIETVALVGLRGMYGRVQDRRYQLKAVWLAASDVTRR
jgi:hypothetical protein